MWLIYRHNDTNFIFLHNHRTDKYSKQIDSCLFSLHASIVNTSFSFYLVIIEWLYWPSWAANIFCKVNRLLFLGEGMVVENVYERKHTCHLREKGIMTDLFFLFRTSLIIWLILILGEGWWLKMCIKDSILVIFGGGVGFKLDLAFFTRMGWGTLCCSSRVSAGMEHPSWLHMKNNFYWKKF